MEESNRSSSSSRRYVSPHLSHTARLERIRRTIRSRTAESLEARRRRSMAVFADDGVGASGSRSSSAAASPVKRRKIEQHHGQVEMTQLDLELVYCDGGKYKETSTRPDSVLYQNEDVYCTRGSHCNMIFQVGGGKCFTLQKMVIQGPITGYDAPVQEGIIFVTMDKQDLVAGCKYPFNFERNDDEDDDEDDDNEFDESDDDADLDVIEFPMLEPREHSPAQGTGSPASFFQTINSQVAARDDGAPLEPSAKFKIKMDEEGNKMRATLTFEPALAGRYILARFFSPNRVDNIDIQFIGAYGYVGRRFFPAIDFR